MVVELQTQLRAAMCELAQLQTMYTNACWYYFECKAIKWHNPWHETWGPTDIYMLGYNFGSHPTYYNGPVDVAPHLPPQILSIEIAIAEGECERLRCSISDVSSYAPGGVGYEALRQQTLVGRGHTF